MDAILDLMSKYGGLGSLVLAAIFYIVFFIVQKKAERKKTAQDTANEIARQAKDNEREMKLLEMLQTVVAEVNMGPKHTVEEQKRDRAINDFVIKQLSTLIEEGADRSYLIKLHNGGRDLCGRGFLKMSIAGESLGSDVVPIMSKYQNLPRTIFPLLYRNLEEKDYYDAEDVELIRTSDPMTYQFLVEHGAKTALFKGIKREDGLLIGIVGVEYLHSPCLDFKEMRKSIDRKANRIAGAIFDTSMQIIGSQEE